MANYTVAFHHATPHGVLTAVHIPDSPNPVSTAVLSKLPPEEAAHAATLRGYRQVQFVGGRIALRSACAQLGCKPPPLLSSDRGAPTLPDGVVGSVSHKRTLAVGMAAFDTGGTLGVDIEEHTPARPAVASRVLRPEELSLVHESPESRQWLQILLRFSLKESVYKALDPYVNRYVGFHEARVTPDLLGQAEVELFLKGGEGPFSVDARYEWLPGRLLTSVRIKPIDG